MAEVIEIDQQARERAEVCVSDLAQKIGAVEAATARLGGFIEDHTLGAAAIGLVGIKAGEMREQLAAITQAIRDMDPDYVDQDSAAA